MAPQKPMIGTQVTAVVTGTFLSGAMMSLSTLVIPVFLDTNTNLNPSHLLGQWARLYHYGHIYLPAGAIATLGLYVYSALSKRASHRKQWLIYAAAGVMTIAMVPFTWVFMSPTNNILFGLEASTSVADLSAVRELVVGWAWLHVLRSLFPLVGAFLGMTGILQELGA